MAKKPQTPKLNKYARREELIEIPSFIVIAVEGDKAEPGYFRMIKREFRDGIKLEIIPSEKNSSPNHLLSNLRRIKREYLDSGSKEKPESFWMVCDVDSHKNFQTTIKEARNEGFEVAISNPCFEVWLFSHLGEIRIEKGVTKFLKPTAEILLEVDSGKKPTRDLSKKIKKILDEIRPKKGSPKCKDVYLERIDDAISRTQKNLEKVQSKDFLLEPKHIGQTRVGELISEIKSKAKNRFKA